jgi:hypothetical protein
MLFLSWSIKSGCLALLVAAILLLQACSKDPHSVRITDKNKDTFLDEIKDMKGLTVGEMQLLMAYQIRSGFAKVFGGKESNIVGKTVGQLIEEARKNAAAEKTEADKQKRLADDTRAKQEAIASELRRALTLTVYDKGFLPSNPLGGSYRDNLIINCVYENASPKDIRAFKGSVIFQDLFGAEIYRANLTISDPISAGAKTQWNGSIEYNQFVPAQKQFRNAELKDMKVIWMPASIIFSDGSRIGETE